jgi:2,3-bisphosphoglycerate-independent phosphoglycerate mutase
MIELDRKQEGNMAADNIKPAILIILDGFGINPSPVNNAVVQANTPKIDHYLASYPHTVLKASGRAVGLPEGQMGNSEVGHLTLGSGTVIRQDLVTINDAIADETFFTNEAFLYALNKAMVHKRPIHLIGLVSDGGVHSHIKHLLALISLCGQRKVKPLLHMFSDGRDTPRDNASSYLPEICQALADAGGAIATLSGRYFAMDRDQRWDRTELAWRAMVLGEGRQAKDPQKLLEDCYANEEFDEFIKPTIFPAAEKISENDQVISFNFRNDRPRQIVAALGLGEFSGFDRGGFVPVEVTCLTRYSEDFDLPVAFESDLPKITLGDVISRAKLKQLRIAETEKYAHITYFLNGGKETPFPGEDRRLIPSPEVSTYDLAPEMSAQGIADTAVEAIRSRAYDFIAINFANGDMVGHTAVREAVIKAVEFMDQQVGRVLDAAVEESYSVVLTADHGNCDEMIDPMTGAPHTQHTVYPVPCIVISPHRRHMAINAGLSSVAPTILELMGLKKPTLMTGESLLLE